MSDTISKWAYNWKILFNPDPKKPRKRYCSLEKNLNVTHRIIYFNNVLVQRANEQKHLDIFLHEKLNFKCHIDKDLHYWK